MTIDIVSHLFDAITKAQALLAEAEASAKTQQDALNIAHDAWQVEVGKLWLLSEAVFAARTVLRNALAAERASFIATDATARAAKGGAA